MDEYSLWLQTNVSSARQDQVRAFADDLGDLLAIKHAANGSYGLAQRGKALARDAFTRCVALDTRVRAGSELEAYCETLAATARVDMICPESEGWTFGPRGRSMAGDADRRYYLIAGWAGGLTPTHCASTCVEIKHFDGVGRL